MNEEHTGKTIESDHNLPEKHDHLILLMIKKLRQSILKSRSVVNLVGISNSE